METAAKRTTLVLLMLLSIFALFATSTLADKKPLPTHPININAATVKELQELPGVGLVTAKAIVQFRMKSGPFHRVEDLLAVRGISEGKLSHMRAYVTVSNGGGNAGGSPATSHTAPAHPAKP